MANETTKITLKIETTNGFGTRYANVNNEKAAAQYTELWEREGHKVTRI